MNKIELTGTDVSQTDLINSIRAINSTDMKVVILNYNIEVRLDHVIPKNEELMVNIIPISFNNKLAFTKAVKDLTMLGLKESKDIVDRIIENGKFSYKIEEFVIDILKNIMSISDFEQRFSKNEKELSDFLTITAQ